MILPLGAFSLFAGGLVLLSAGFFTMLEPLFGTGAFDEGGHLFTHFLATSSPMEDALSSSWAHLQDRYQSLADAPPTSGPLAATAAHIDASARHLQRSLTEQLEDAGADALDDAIRALPHCPTRHAWMSADSFSSQWVTAWPSPDHAISTAEFGEVLATYLGLPSPALRSLVGLSIPDGPTQHRVCDAYGLQLASAHLPGRGWDDHHDAILRTIHRDVIRCGIRGDLEPRSLFAATLPAAAIRRVGARRLGIIPDLRLHGVPFPDRHHSGRTHGFLFDLKTIHDGTAPYQSAAARDERSAAVAARARYVPTEYEAAARRLDQHHHGVSADDVAAGRVAAGPVLSLLRSYPECVGLVFGAFGEASPSVHTLLTTAATAGAEGAWQQMGSRTEAEARAFLTGRLRRSWGVAAVRAAAHLRVSRLAFVGMPAAVVRGLRRATRAPYRGPVSPRVYREGLRPDLGARRVVRG